MLNVLRIHDVLVWIRIRRSMPLTNGSGSGFGSGSCYFRHWPSECQQKINLKKFFCFLGTFWRYIYIIFKDLKSKRSHTAVGIKVFLFLLGVEGSGSIPLTNGSGSGSRSPKTCGSGSGSATLRKRMCCKAAWIVRNVFQTFEKGRKFFQGKCKHRFLKFINLNFARVIQIFMSKVGNGIPGRKVPDPDPQHCW